ncbi:hypothetical protein GPJ56_009044 [Histomonas meleagridis]|uniref:uncharacterized protein n=1 Tax=Histomonas meleagridis TaxID=135588 RepID=UPI003559A6DC|nr:hypothetical protein GPJ56_009044 [Histomonas meleagridis]KAH0799301.1 hypothetical protein GO595_008098 [Histomonas meleagridis]
MKDEVSKYTEVISFFIKKNDILAESVLQAIKANPQIIDQLAYSTIPGLFGNFLSSESCDKFANFMEEIISKEKIEKKSEQDLLSYHFASVLFVIPQFRQFLDEINNDLSDFINWESDIDQITADEYAVKFFNSWKDNAEFCPSIICKILSMYQSPVKCLFYSFLLPAFKSPRAFGIVPHLSKPSNKTINSIVGSIYNYSKKLWGALKSVENPAEIFSSKRLDELNPDLSQVVLLTPEDIDMITLLSRYAEGLEEISFENQFKKSNYFYPYKFILQKKQTKPQGEGLLLDDHLEKCLRKILINLDILVTSDQPPEEMPNVIEFLRSQVLFANNSHRLILESNINEFEAQFGQRFPNQRFSDCIKLLKSKFEARRSNHISLLSEFSVYDEETQNINHINNILNDKIKDYRNYIDQLLVEKYLADHSPIAYIDKFYTDRAEFINFYNELSLDFDNWRKSNGYVSSTRIIPDHLHNNIMKNLTYERFLELNPQYKELDERFYNVITNNYNTILRNQSYEYTDPFIKNPLLLEPMLKDLRKMLDPSTKLPLQKVYYYKQSFEDGFAAYEVESPDYPGADQMQPLEIILIANLKPINFESNHHYVMHFTDEDKFQQYSGTLTRLSSIEDYFTKNYK